MPRLRLLIAFLIVLNIFALLVLWSGGSSTSAGEPERLNNQLNPDSLTLVAPAQASPGTLGFIILAVICGIFAFTGGFR